MLLKLQNEPGRGGGGSLVPGSQPISTNESRVNEQSSSHLEELHPTPHTPKSSVQPDREVLQKNIFGTPTHLYGIGSLEEIQHVPRQAVHLKLFQRETRFEGTEDGHMREEFYLEQVPCYQSPFPY